MPKRKFLDLTGQIFDKLVVVDRETDPKHILHHAVTWYCMCECGNFKRATTSQLVRGRAKNCGCEPSRSRPRINIKGQRFGELVAIKHAPDIVKKTAWVCKCDCGKYREVQTTALRAGKATSCGHCHPYRKNHAPAKVYDHL